MVSYVTLSLPKPKTPMKCFSIAQHHYEPLNLHYPTYKVISDARTNVRWLLMHYWKLTAVNVATRGDKARINLTHMI